MRVIYLRYGVGTAGFRPSLYPVGAWVNRGMPGLAGLLIFTKHIRRRLNLVPALACVLTFIIVLPRWVYDTTDTNTGRAANP